MIQFKNKEVNTEEVKWESLPDGTLFTFHEMLYMVISSHQFIIKAYKNDVNAFERSVYAVSINHGCLTSYITRDELKKDLSYFKLVESGTELVYTKLS